MAHLVADRQLLKSVARWLKPEDFAPKNGTGGEGWARWVVANLALNYWNQYRHPLGDLLIAEAKRYVETSAISEKQKLWLADFCKRLKETTLEAGEVIAERVVEYKRERARFEAFEEIVALQQSGELTDDKMLTLCRGVVDTFKTESDPWVEVFSPGEVEARILRRQWLQGGDNPPLLIDPLDIRTQMIGRGQVGLWVAPYKRGKSLALAHTSVAYAIQGLNALHVTCEDPKEVVEDRLDAMVSQLPIQELFHHGPDVAARLKQFKRMLMGRLWIRDATEGQCSLSWLEGQLEEARDKGFPADALIVDYDDEIRPPKSYGQTLARRFEFADIYRMLRQLASRWGVFLWTAAQTQRDTEGLRIISGDRTAEDISKIRKATVAISIGNGTDRAENAHYLWVCASKVGKKFVGTYICHREDQGIFYHREDTRKLLAQIKKEKEQHG